MIERYFENRSYGSYAWNAGFYDLPIEYEQRMFAKLPIYCLTRNIVQRLKISSIGLSLDNRIYESNPRSSYFDDVPFDGYERLIDRQWIYLQMKILYLGWTMVQVFTYKLIECKNNKGVVWCTDILMIKKAHDIT